MNWTNKLVYFVWFLVFLLCQEKKCFVNSTVPEIVSTERTSTASSGGMSPTVENLNRDNEDADVFLNMARDYRDGKNQKIGKNLPRAVHYYQYSIEKGKGKILTEAIVELLGLVEEHPQLESKYNSWDLLLAAATRGDPDAQHKLSTALAVGIYQNSLVPMDSARSLLLEYVAALSGNPEASIGMGYRYAHGIGLVQSCEKALPFYEYAANLAIEHLEKQNGFVAPVDRTRLSESLESSFRLLKESSHELADYYSHLAENGEVTAASILGNIYTTGSKNIDPDEELAIYYLKLANKMQSSIQSNGLLGYLLAKRYHYRQIYGRDPIKATSSSLTGTKKASFNEQEDTPQRIQQLLQSSTKLSDLNALVGLGFIYMNGIGVEINQTKALEYFQKALPSHPDAGFYMGEIIMKQQSQRLHPSPTAMSSGHTNGWRNHDITAALQAYSTSTQLGNVFAQHRLAQMHNHGWGAPRSCEAALVGFRGVAERGPWAARLAEAQKDHQQGESGVALSKLAGLAAIGYEIAQYNAAFLLFKSHCPGVRSQSMDKKWLEAVMAENSQDPEEIHEQFHAMNYVTSTYTRSSSSPAAPVESALSERSASESFSSSSSSLLNQSQVLSPSELQAEECDHRALSLFALSAAQQNSDAFVQIGDFYYYRFQGYNDSRGIAASYYQKAADLHNTQAIFNLGLMHEIGDGVKQDFHLAKRYYDLAAEVDAKARTPRDIALFLLESHKYLLSLIYSETMQQYVDAQELEAFLSQCLKSLVVGVQWLDQRVHYYSYQLKARFFSSISQKAASTASSSSSGTSRGTGNHRNQKNNNNPHHHSHYSEPKTSPLIVEDYLPEHTKYYVLKVLDQIQRGYEEVIRLLKLLSTELQRDLKMKEEEASLLILLTFFLLGLIGMQAGVFVLSRLLRARLPPQANP